jgi:hypothetical protein
VNHSRLRVPLPYDPTMLPRNLFQRIFVSGEIRRRLACTAKRVRPYPGVLCLGTSRWKVVYMESEVRYRKSSYNMPASFSTGATESGRMRSKVFDQKDKSEAKRNSTTLLRHRHRRSTWSFENLQGKHSKLSDPFRTCVRQSGIKHEG